MAPYVWRPEQARNRQQISRLKANAFIPYSLVPQLRNTWCLRCVEFWPAPQRSTRTLTVSTLETLTFTLTTASPASVPRTVGRTRSDFAHKLPIAVEADSAVFVQVDPGHLTDKGLRSWGAAHGRLGAALRKHGRSIHVVAVVRADRALQRVDTASLGRHHQFQGSNGGPIGGPGIRQDQTARAHGDYGSA